MRRTPDKLWHDAVHEAGYAVIARALGLTSCYTNLAPDYPDQRWGESLIFDVLQCCGWNRRHPERNGNDTAFWDGTTIASMAGAEAEREIIGTCLGRDERGAQSSDLIRNDLEHPDGRAHRTERMRRFAQQLVKKHRAAILRFAEQLVAVDELDELLAR